MLGYIYSLMLLFQSLIRDLSLGLPTEALLKVKQAGMQLEFYYEWLGQAHHQVWVGLATFARTT